MKYYCSLSLFLYHSEGKVLVFDYKMMISCITVTSHKEHTHTYTHTKGRTVFLFLFLSFIFLSFCLLHALWTFIIILVNYTRIIATMPCIHSQVWNNPLFKKRKLTKYSRWVVSIICGRSVSGSRCYTKLNYDHRWSEFTLICHWICVFIYLFLRIHLSMALIIYHHSLI